MDRQELDRSIVQHYTDQPGRLPGTIRAGVERLWDGRPVQLYALADLDEELRLGRTRVVLGPDQVVLVQGEDAHPVYRRIDRDRIREVRGKAPRLTEEMINTSINQTLSRTLLTSLTTLLVVVVLYFGGGQAIHVFAFALVVGVVVGTYSSIFVASPVLFWMAQSASSKQKGKRSGSGVSRGAQQGAKCDFARAGCSKPATWRNRQTGQKVCDEHREIVDTGLQMRGVQPKWEPL